MYTVRDLLAIVLAGVLGIALVLKPEAVLRLQWFLFDASTTGRSGRWGDDDGTLELKSWHRWAARAVGAIVLAIGAAIAAMPHL
ncbi:hypothetical protein GCM10028857_22360 [Salinarchaeum chitinilyticum]